MPLTPLRQPPYRPPKEAVANWNSWRKGLNLLLRQNEVDASELTLATNLLLSGSGVPSKRWGSRDYFLAGPTTAQGVRFVGSFKDNMNNQEVLAITNHGVLTQKSGTSYTQIVGASWPSGSDISATQLGDNVYVFSDMREMVRYNFSTLVSFATIASPSNLLATNLSGVTTGLTEYSWVITSVGRSGGETVASDPVVLSTLPQDLTTTTVRVSWDAVSTASGDLTGYNIYRGTLGNEKWLGGVDANTVSFDDPGLVQPDPFKVKPETGTTGGPRGKYAIRFQDRLIIAGIPGEPSKVLISGRWPQQERFDWFAGGALLIEPDAGENITGLGIFQEKLVVFKENSVWQVKLSQVQYGQNFVLDPQYQLLTASQGCLSHRSIVPVENDVMFANRQGIYILRYEPQLLTVLNANEISAKIRPFFESLSDEDHQNSSAIYADKKYIISYPIAKKTIMFDRERLSFMGPWATDFGIAGWEKYVDSTGNERWIAADYDDSFVTEFSKNYHDDKGSVIRTILKTKQEDFDDWTLFKTVNEVYLNFRAVTGSVNVNIYLENRNGNTITAKSFTITGPAAEGTSGFGTDVFGTVLFGLTDNAPTTSEDELPRKAFIYKTSRTFQIEVRTENLTDNYELLGIKAIAIPQARGNSPSSWNVSN